MGLRNKLGKLSLGARKTRKDSDLCNRENLNESRETPNG